MFTPDTKRTLRSGQSPLGQWRDINRQSDAHQHTTAETVNNGHALASHPRMLRTPLGGGSFRGEYSATVSYNLQDMVVISTGSNAGTYICVAASTGNNPWAGGGYWVQISGIPANIYL
jgi:hypothetical protein